MPGGDRARGHSGRDLLQRHADLEQAAGELQRLAEDYVELERIAGVPSERSYPPPYEASGPSAEQAASYVASAERNRLSLGDGPIGNLRERLETDLGVRVFEYPMPLRVAGLFAYNVPLAACIGINASHPSDRRQWSLAHEFGCFLMDRFRAEIALLETGRRASRRERLAEAFAEHFLMPAAGLERRLTEMAIGRPSGITLADVVALADLYRVSVQAMVLRLEALRRLPAGTWDRLRNEGFNPRQTQPGASHADSPVGTSLPRRYVTLAAEAFRRGGLSKGQLARYLRTDRVSARHQVARERRRIYSETDEFAGLSDLDLAQPLSAR